MEIVIIKLAFVLVYLDGLEMFVIKKQHNLFKYKNFMLTLGIKNFFCKIPYRIKLIIFNFIGLHGILHL